ncbi:pyroglutamyl-peptidase 1-like protein isoform X2 [Ursus arctos]|uniref:pyroglutamyl-peptidase 1-like protein isoform X2 n=1 Tax=Ursus arctos TaxID=9644 RepID=UPI00201719FF|nr:pyroglutamyl-peptidase 1-like protein isoform X2 [Ursus arctos]
MDSQPSCVVVTGFGPFRQHLVNSSWEAVKELSKLGLNSDVKVELRILQLPVDYREVKQRVTRIWEDLRPQLAVHIGMDASAKAIVLEQCAKNRGYRDADIRGFRPARGECLPDGPEVIASEVSMKAVSKRVAVEGVEVTFSRDAGSQAAGKSPAGHHPGHAEGAEKARSQSLVCRKLNCRDSSPREPIGGLLWRKLNVSILCAEFNCALRDF